MKKLLLGILFLLPILLSAVPYTVVGEVFTETW